MMTVEMAFWGLIIGAVMGTLAHVIIEMWQRPAHPSARKHHWLKDAIDEVNNGTK